MPPFPSGPSTTAYASPVDVERYGEYRITQTPDDPRPLYRFTGTLAPEAGRYHLWSGWFCPWAHRSTLVVALAGIEDAVSVSYVDQRRDARGWAFRETDGPDPVNGFTLLRDAYEATESGFDGHVSVPTLWDRQAGRIASNDYATLDAELATRFQQWSRTGLELYPADLRAQIDDLDRRLQPAVNRGVGAAAGSGPDADQARDRLHRTLRELDTTLASSRYLLGDRLTLADVRLWVTLVRFHASAAGGRVGIGLADLPSLFSYARELLQQEAFGDTTDFTTYGAGDPTPAGWSDPPTR
jgi:putative glutathione S-transferase